MHFNGLKKKKKEEDAYLVTYENCIKFKLKIPYKVFIGTQLCSFFDILSVTVLLQCQNQVVAKPVILTIHPFAERTVRTSQI